MCLFLISPVKSVQDNLQLRFILEEDLERDFVNICSEEIDEAGGKRGHVMMKLLDPAWRYKMVGCLIISS